MPTDRGRPTIARLMAKVALAAFLIAPVGCVLRWDSPAQESGCFLLMVFYLNIAFFRFLYRGFRLPFG